MKIWILYVRAFMYMRACVRVCVCCVRACVCWVCAYVHVCFAFVCVCACVRVRVCTWKWMQNVWLIACMHVWTCLSKRAWICELGTDTTWFDIICRPFTIGLLKKTCHRRTATRHCVDNFNQECKVNFFVHGICWTSELNNLWQLINCWTCGSGLGSS